MSIPAHQIRNILKSYARLLCRKENSSSPLEGEPGRFTKKFRFNAEAKRRMVIARVVDEIIQRITDSYGTSQSAYSEMAVRKNQNQTRKDRVQSDGTELIFFRIERDGKKRKFRIRRRR